jgi:hypothetical protein
VPWGLVREGREGARLGVRLGEGRGTTRRGGGARPTAPFSLYMEMLQREEEELEERKKKKREKGRKAKGKEKMEKLLNLEILEEK